MIQEELQGDDKWWTTIKFQIECILRILMFIQNYAALFYITLFIIVILESYRPTKPMSWSLTLQKTAIWR